jgi:hypothetical protein
MNFQQKYPDFAAIEDYILAARVERAVYVSSAIVKGINWLMERGKGLAAALNRSVEAEIERRAIESDPFLKRSVTCE